MISLASSIFNIYLLTAEAPSLQFFHRKQTMHQALEYLLCILIFDTLKAMFYCIKNYQFLIIRYSTSFDQLLKSEELLFFVHKFNLQHIPPPLLEIEC